MSKYRAFSIEKSLLNIWFLR